MPNPMPTAPAARAAGAWCRMLRAASLVVAVAIATAGHAMAQETRIAFIDMKRLLDNAPQVQAGRDALQREFAQRDVDLKAQEARLAELEERQRRESGLLPKAESDTRQAEIDTLRRSIERLRGRLREELNARGEAELRRRWDEVHDVVVELARERRYDLVLQAPVVYAAPTIDITDEVLERLRRKAGAQAP